MDIDIKAFERKAKRNKKKFGIFLKGLKRKRNLNLNPIAKKLDRKAFEEIDCLKCGNCCKTMTPTWTTADIHRVSAHLRLSVTKFKEKYIEKDESGDWVNRELPCPFLAKDNKCNIYNIRPRDCRGFPHLHTNDFIKDSEVNLDNITHCPITYSVIENMYKIVAQKDEALLQSLHPHVNKTHY
jgi:Fe-S-cluster containining protein